MGLYSLVLHHDSAWEILNLMGNMNCIQFIDMNTDEQIIFRKFSPLIRKCEEIETSIQYMLEEAEKLQISPQKPKDFSKFKEWLEEITVNSKKDPSSLLDHIHNECQSLKDSMAEQVTKYKSMYDSLVRLIERKVTLSKAYSVVSSITSSLDLNNQVIPNIKSEGPVLNGMKYVYLVGLIKMEDIFKFKRLIFRSTRGNAIVYIKNIDIPFQSFEGINTKKSVYIIVYKESEHLKLRIKKICESMGPDCISLSIEERLQEEANINKSIDELKELMNVTRVSIIERMNKITEEIGMERGSLIMNYFIFVRREKSIYQILNMLKAENYLFRGLFWAPKSQEIDILSSFSQLEQNHNIIMPKINSIHFHHLNPPTKLRKNAFLDPFQEIVNLYGIPSYQEINPGFFTIITFPFFFAMMFGDALHGLYVFIISLVLCIMGKKLNKIPSVLRGLFNYRFIFLLMGFFSIYCGILYSEFGSSSINIFSTCYTNKDYETERIEQCTYPFGLDYKWQVSSNQLLFVNSFKMKFSVIIGIMQMILGIVLKGMNNYHYKISFIFEFIPQLFLMTFIFGYLIIIILIKWGIDWTGKTAFAPSITTYFSDMFIQFGNTKEYPIIGNATSQRVISQIFLVLIILCVPCLLIVKPLLQRRKHKSKDLFIEKEQANLIKFNDKELDIFSGISSSLPLKGDLETDPIIRFIHKDKEDFIFGKFLLFHLIENIEFIMSSISNTASYLRLWALSLAHSELSRIFFHFTLGIALRSETPNFGIIFLLNFLLHIISLFILVCMNLLECVLHSVRLHWIEFQNKFYSGKGYNFVPFNLVDLDLLLSSKSK